MIETILDHEGDDRDLEGLFVLGGLPLDLVGAWFPGTPLFVEKSGPLGHLCRNIRMQWDDAGNAVGVAKASREWDDHRVRVRPEYVRFICESEDDVIALLNTRANISRLLDRRGHETDDAVRSQILEAISVAVEGQEQGLPSP